MTLTTAAIPPAAYTIETADERAILAVLSRQAPDAAGQAWENEKSGARGLITAVTREPDDGRDCLAFTTTRENFDGIHLYRGLACEDAAGDLRMHAFARM